MYEHFLFGAHPMAILVVVVGALSTFNPDLDPSNVSHRWKACIQTLAQFPSLAAMAYKTSLGQPPVYPKADYGYAENFLHMMFTTPLEEYKINPVHVKAVDAFLILHADHEQNASTSTVRIAGSSLANPYACIASGVASLWGPMHGGANEVISDDYHYFHTVVILLQTVLLLTFFSFSFSFLFFSFCVCV